MGNSWDYENEISLGTDAREPYFITFNNTLIFSYFQAGTGTISLEILFGNSPSPFRAKFLFILIDPVAFEPKYLFRIRRLDFQKWTDPEIWGHPGEIAWQLRYLICN